MSKPAHVLTRRQFGERLWRMSAAAGAAQALPWLRGVGYAQSTSGTPRMLPHMVDLDGDGRSTSRDQQLVDAALKSTRGWNLRPLEGYDFRADLLARGHVDRQDRSLLRRLQRAATSDIAAERPVTIAWHYGWYNNTGRRAQTVRFLGGNYRSSDRTVEATFNDLKTEFGITVDALSWISPRVDPRPVRNLSRGYLRAGNVGTRQVALLYESRISLPFNRDRINFMSTDARGNLVEDFGLMGAFLRQRVRGRGVSVYALDRRPVVFLYATHSWVDDSLSDVQFDALDATLEDAIDRFHAEYGERPFLVGEEMLLAPSDEFGEDRLRRSRNFDALFVYHHAAAVENILGGNGVLGDAYAEQQEKLLRRTIRETATIVNRFTGIPLVLIPSLAAGFAKFGLPTLSASRAEYEAFLWRMISFLDEKYYAAARAVLEVPVYTLGSWNEEYEGHALFPFQENGSVPTRTFSGFDLSLAVKRVFGWNQQAARLSGS